MSWNLLDLPWLPAAPSDFRAQCGLIEERDAADAGQDIIRLASHALDTSQLNQLSERIKTVNSSNVTKLTNFRLAVLGSGTTCQYVPTLAASAARYGVNLSVIQAEYNQYVQEAISPDSATNRSSPNAVLVALDIWALNLHQPDLTQDDAENSAKVSAALSTIETIQSGISKGCGASLILQTIPQPPMNLFGNLEFAVEGTVRKNIEQFNSELRRLAVGGNHILLDLEALTSAIGTENWYNPKQYNLYKLPFSLSVVPFYSDHIARLIAASSGKARKCLVLDLDNTLWGGVIGDDGLSGIKLGQGDPVGEAHLELQQVVLSLRERGIIIAVSSKNDDSIARRAFKEHPEMVLKEEHIAVFQANWEDKASNLVAIAKALNIGVDSLVFFDDNPAERALIRQAVPGVAVPELPVDPSYYGRALLSCGYFETVSFSQEDKMRAEQYAANEKRVVLAEQSSDITQYLHSLEMVAQFKSFDENSIPRITQLINKTNQFNLTTRRYNQSEVQAMLDDEKLFGLQVRLKDVFGDNGMIAVVIAKMHVDSKHEWEIDSWLMSCRVLGRLVELATMNRIVAEAKKRGIKTIKGRYVPTEKNALVSKHYELLGFQMISSNGGETHWRLDVDSYRDKDVQIMTEA